MVIFDLIIEKALALTVAGCEASGSVSAMVLWTNAMGAPIPAEDAGLLLVDLAVDGARGVVLAAGGLYVSVAARTGPMGAFPSRLPVHRT